MAHISKKMGIIKGMERWNDLRHIHEKWFAQCTCKLRETATQAVPGYGSPDAEIVFVGEAPGKTEDLQGKPFIGSAGKFLSEMLASIHMIREDIYITNIVKSAVQNSTALQQCSAVVRHFRATENEKKIEKQ